MYIFWYLNIVHVCIGLNVYPYGEEMEAILIVVYL